MKREKATERRKDEIMAEGKRKEEKEREELYICAA
jgi:hypothetical protein